MAWEDVKAIFRPDTVHMGVMAIDKESCTKCDLCMENCPFRAWEHDEEGYPRIKQEYECFSCFNCKVACPVDAISIVENYHVHEGFWATNPKPLPVKMPQEPRDAEGKLTEWSAVERLMLERRSVRNYRDKPVPEPLIRRVLEAGRFAPSAGNCQPWKFVVVTDKTLIKEMDEAIFNSLSGVYGMYKNDDMVKMLAGVYESNAAQGPGSYDPRLSLGGMGAIARKYGPPLLNAPVVILIAGDARAVGGTQINVGICGENMNLTALALGLGACWVGFAQVLNMAPAMMEKLGLRPPWSIISSMVLGYPKFRQQGMVPREYRPITWFREGASGPEIEE